MSLGQADVGRTMRNIGCTEQNVGCTCVMSVAIRLMFVKDQRGALCAPQGQWAPPTPIHEKKLNV